MTNNNLFQLRTALVLSIAIVYGAKLLRSDSNRINKTLINSSVNDVLRIMNLVMKSTTKE